MGRERGYRENERASLELRRAAQMQAAMAAMRHEAEGEPMPPGILARIGWAVRRGNRYMARRFGFDTKENLALTGAMLAAPVAVIASPLLGVGVAVALTTPHLYASARRVRRMRMALYNPPDMNLDGSWKEQPEAQGEPVGERPQEGTHPEGDDAPVVISRKEWERTQKAISSLLELAQDQVRKEAQRQRLLRELAGETELMRLALAQMEHGPEALEQAQKLFAEQARRLMREAGMDPDELGADEEGQGEAEPQLRGDDELSAVSSWIDVSGLSPERREELRQAIRKGRERVKATKPSWGRLDKQEILEMLKPQGPYNREQYLEQRRRARDQEPPPAVMAIEPHWAEPLLDGTMKYEFRLDGSNALKDVRPGARVAIYGAKDEGAGELLGYYTVGERFDVTLENVHEHWPKLKGRIPHNFKDFVRYLQASKDGRVVVTGVANPQRMRRSVDLYERLGAPVQGGRVVKDKKVRDTILDAIDENDAAICEEAGGQYPWSEGTRPSVPFLYRALRSKLNRGDSLAMPGYDEEFFERLKRENPGLEGKWKAHLKRVKERHAQVRSKQKTARKAQGGQRKASGAAA